LIPIETAVQGVKNGDINLYEIIIKHFQQQLVHYCYHMLGNVQEAEDAVQDSFIKAYEKIESYNNSISFSAWLYKITYHRCLNIIRRKKLVSFIPFVEETNVGTTAIETRVEENDFSRTFAHALKKLSSSDKSILILRVLEEKSFEEIGKILNMKSATVRKRYERSKKKLRLILTSKEGVILNEGFSNCQ